MKEQEQMYAEPTTPLDRLREQVQEAEAEVSNAQDWTSKTRAEQAVKSIRRVLESAEFAAKRAQGSRQQQQAARQRRREESTRFVRSDDGGSYLEVQNTALPEEPSRQQYMPIASSGGGGGRSGQSWPQSFSERHALVKAALGELRQASVA